jgi:hypothetical protein
LFEIVLSKANLIMTKEIWTRPLNFLQPLKLQSSFVLTLLLRKFHFKNTTNNFGQHMLQPFATTTIAFSAIGVHGAIDGNFART